MRLCEKVTTRALRLAVLPSKSHARSLITNVDRDEDVAAGEVRLRFRGVPVKAVAVATTRARRRAVMADLMAINGLRGRGGRQYVTY